MYPKTKDYIEKIWRKFCKRESLPVEEVTYFVGFLLRWWLSMHKVCLSSSFWVGKWSTFTCVRCFVLEISQLRYLNFCGAAQKFGVKLSI